MTKGMKLGLLVGLGVVGLVLLANSSKPAAVQQMLVPTGPGPDPLLDVFSLEGGHRYQIGPLTEAQANAVWQGTSLSVVTQPTAGAIGELIVDAVSNTNAVVPVTAAVYQLS